MKNKILLFITVLLLTFFNYSIFKQEEHIKTATTVYFELAPLDPRSFMQGDYMDLSYQIENDISELYKEKEYDQKMIERESIIVEFDDKKVGKFISLYKDGDKLSKNQILLPFRYKTIRSIDISLSDSYLFQEGTGELFVNAKYGVFKYADNKFILIALADENMKIIDATETSK